MLKMKTRCERCETCTREMNGVCPNCSGELLNRPRRKPQTGVPVRNFDEAESGEYLDG